jgi:hypothetical protein
MVYVPASFAGPEPGKRATQGLRRGVSPGGMSPVVAGSFTGNNGGVGHICCRLGGWGGRGVKNEMADVGEDSGPKQVTFSCGLLFFGPKEFPFSFCNEASCVPKLKHGCLVVCDFGRYTNVVEGGNCTIDKEALPDMGIKHPKAHVVDFWVLLGADWVRTGAGV